MLTWLGHSYGLNCGSVPRLGMSEEISIQYTTAVINSHYMALGQQPRQMNNTWIPVDETLEGSYQYPAVSFRKHSSPSGVNLVRIQAKQVVRKSHDTTGANAGSENELVQLPQADCFSVDASWVIPHKDNGSFLVSLTHITDRSLICSH